MKDEVIEVNLKEFTKAYEKAVNANKSAFNYDGKVFVTDFAKYVIEYWESKQKNNEIRNRSIKKSTT